MTITSVRGHVTHLDFDSAYRGWSSCSPAALFKDASIAKVVPQEHENLQRNLEREVRGAHVLMLWLDCDREGENICFEVMDICRRVNHRLRSLRARFSAVTANDVRHALTHLNQPNRLQSDAVEARQEIDLRIGAAFTRFQTLVLQNRFEGLVESLVSYGPCQFPCLGFVAERHARIESFIPEDFWKLKMSATVAGPSQEGTDPVHHRPPTDGTMFSQSERSQWSFSGSASESTITAQRSSSSSAACLAEKRRYARTHAGTHARALASRFCPRPP
eukprot:scaffold789_cov261-Pinguiococcus_pyrenoidosus.AAC.17